MQMMMPNKSGRAKESKVALALFVSFAIVIMVVVQGKWHSAKMTAQSAVSKVQPFCMNTSAVSGAYTSEEEDVYIISAIGKTISFAGIPSKNAAIITPSSPINTPKG